MECRDLEAIGILSIFFSFLNDALEIMLSTRMDGEGDFPHHWQYENLETIPSITRLDRKQGPKDQADSALSVVCPWKYPPYNGDTRCLSLGE